MAISVKLEAFEGPLDLLLHLIEKNKVDIYDIPIVEITEQYMEYVRQMTAESAAAEQAEDLSKEPDAREALNTRTCDVMSEFLVMAATLLDIKCRMLLPAQVNEEGEEEDPRAELVEKLLEGIPVRLGVTYREFLESTGANVPGRYSVNCSGEPRGCDNGDTFDKVLYTGMVDEYFDYELGELAYRSLRFEEECLPDCDNFQGNAVVNYTEREVPYTRIIEHKHFEFGTGRGTIITREYPAAWKRGDEPYYPMNDDENNALFEQYRQLADREKNVLFGGRLGQYRYYDMDKVIGAALELVSSEIA